MSLSSVTSNLRLTRPIHVAKVEGRTLFYQASAQTRRHGRGMSWLPFFLNQPRTSPTTDLKEPSGGADGTSHLGPNPPEAALLRIVSQCFQTHKWHWHSILGRSSPRGLCVGTRVPAGRAEHTACGLTPHWLPERHPFPAPVLTTPADSLQPLGFKNKRQLLQPW